eukprot:2391698-Rhodomonas_salina.2
MRNQHNKRAILAVGTGNLYSCLRFRGAVRRLDIVAARCVVLREARLLPGRGAFASVLAAKDLKTGIKTIVLHTRDGRSGTEIGYADTRGAGSNQACRRCCAR